MNTLFPLTFSSSMLEDLWGCPLNWFRKYCQKLSVGGNGFGNSDLIAGGLMASALEITRKAFYNDKLPHQEAIELGRISILEGQNTGHGIKTNEKLADVFVAYFRRFPMNSGLQPVELVDGKHGIEYKFELDLGIPHPELARNLIFTGKLDFLGEKYLEGKLQRFVVDDKTCSSVSVIAGTREPDLEREKEEYHLRGQLMGYVWAVGLLEKQLNIDIGCKGAMIRRIPIMKDITPAFEIPIQITKFMVQSWEQATMNRIGEMRERYLAFKDNGSKDIRQFFPPVYNTSCTKWTKQTGFKMGIAHDFNYTCPFAIGCLIKDGDEMLLANSLQEVGYPEVPLERGRVSLKQYLKEIQK